MPRKSKYEIVLDAAKIVLETNQIFYYKYAFADKVHNELKNHNNNIKLSTCRTHIRNLIKDGIITEEKTETAYTYSIKKTTKEKYYHDFPLLGITSSLTYTLYEKVETIAFTISNQMAMPIASLLNSLYNTENLYFQNISSSMIICYRILESTATASVELSKHIEKILTGLELKSDALAKSIHASYIDIYSGNSFYYDADTNHWISESPIPSENQYGGELKARSLPHSRNNGSKSHE